MMKNTMRLGVAGAFAICAMLLAAGSTFAQQYPTPPQVKTSVTTPGGLPTTNPEPGSTVMLSTQLLDSRDQPVVGADVTFSLDSVPPGSDASFLALATAAVGVPTGGPAPALKALWGITSITATTDVTGTAKVQLNVGRAVGEIVVTVVVDGEVIATSEITVGAVPAPPSTGSGLEDFAGNNWSLFVLAGAVAAVIAGIGVRTRLQR